MNFKAICSAFGCGAVHTDEDYLKVLRRQQRLFIGMMILGIITFAVAALAEVLSWDISLNSHSLGFYSGVGTGLTLGSAIFLLRLRKAMKDPKALREARIKATDERTLDISRRSLAAAGYALLIAVYLACLIGGLFYPELLMVLAGLACVFLTTYVISYFIYNKLM